MDNAAIGKLLRQTATLMELAGENAFKAKAYDRAADAIGAFEHSVEDLVRAGRGLELEGVGKSIESALVSILDTGTFAKLDELRTQIPAGVVELSRISGLGTKKLQSLWQELNITSIPDFREALEDGTLASAKGFGEKSLAGLRASVHFYEANRGKLRLPDAELLANSLATALKSQPGILDATVAGEVRRSLPVVNELSIVAAADNPDATVMGLGGRLGLEESVYDTTLDILTGYTPTGQTVHIQLVTPANFNQSVANATLPNGTEVALLHQLTSSPPETWDWLAQHPDQIPTAPARLLELSDIKGVLHAHSTWSDGQHTLREMAQACIQRGYQYLGITDHSRTASYAGGLSIERVAAQHLEIDALNAELAPFRIFKGIESDILADGSLDYPTEVLATFDFVIGSIHSGFKMTEAEGTQRLIRAAQNPFCTMLGHPTGRLLLAREGYPLDMRAIIDACAAAGTSIELNSHPYRLDLDWAWLPYAIQRGVLTGINPDAHKTGGIDDMRWGVRVGRKGLLTPASTLNTFSVDALADYFSHRRQQALA